jgi:hypothetical protein
MATIATVFDRHFIFFLGVIAAEVPLFLFIMGKALVNVSAI